MSSNIEQKPESRENGILSRLGKLCETVRRGTNSVFQTIQKVTFDPLRTYITGNEPIVRNGKTIGILADNSDKISIQNGEETVISINESGDGFEVHLMKNSGLIRDVTGLRDVYVPQQTINNELPDQSYQPNQTENIFQELVTNELEKSDQVTISLTTDEELESRLTDWIPEKYKNKTFYFDNGHKKGVIYYANNDWVWKKNDKHAPIYENNKLTIIKTIQDKKNEFASRLEQNGKANIILSTKEEKQTKLVDWIPEQYRSVEKGKNQLMHIDNGFQEAHVYYNKEVDDWISIEHGHPVSIYSNNTIKIVDNLSDKIGEIEGLPAEKRWEYVMNVQKGLPSEFLTNYQARKDLNIAMFGKHTMKYLENYCKEETPRNGDSPKKGLYYLHPVQIAIMLEATANYEETENVVFSSTTRTLKTEKIIYRNKNKRPGGHTYGLKADLASYHGTILRRKHLKFLRKIRKKLKPYGYGLHLTYSTNYYQDGKKVMKHSGHRDHIDIRFSDLHGGLLPKYRKLDMQFAGVEAAEQQESDFDANLFAYTKAIELKEKYEKRKQEMLAQNKLPQKRLTKVRLKFRPAPDKKEIDILPARTEIIALQQVEEKGRRWFKVRVELNGKTQEGYVSANPRYTQFAGVIDNDFSGSV